MKSLMKRFSVVALLLAVISTPAAAENMKKMGNMNIHYIALGATFFTPEVARAYGIERSKYNGLVNISVLDNTKDGTPAKVVTITGTARNLLGQKKELNFKEVKEGDAIYYLAQVSYRNDETISFDLMVSDGKESHNLKFKQKFYVD